MQIFWVILMIICMFFGPIWAFWAEDMSKLLFCATFYNSVTSKHHHEVFEERQTHSSITEFHVTFLMT